MISDKVNSKHFVGIDLIRFFAAALVLFFHYGLSLGRFTHGRIVLVNGAATSYPELYDISNYGWVGVEIFFVISGFVIAFSAEKASPFSFFSSRVTRLGPGVWICATLTLAATLAVGLNPHDEIVAYLRSIFFRSYWPLDRRCLLDPTNRNSVLLFCLHIAMFQQIHLD